MRTGRDVAGPAFALGRNTCVRQPCNSLPFFVTSANSRRGWKEKSYGDKASRITALTAPTARVLFLAQTRHLAWVPRAESVHVCCTLSHIQSNKNSTKFLMTKQGAC